MRRPCDSLGIDRTVSDVLYVLNEKESRLRLCEFGWVRRRFIPTVLKQLVVSVAKAARCVELRRSRRKTITKAPPSIIHPQYRRECSSCYWFPISVLTYLDRQSGILDECSCLLWIKSVNSSHRDQFRWSIEECSSTVRSKNKRSKQSALNCPKGSIHREGVTELEVRVACKTDKKGGGSVRAAQFWPRHSTCTPVGQLRLPCALRTSPIGKKAFGSLELTSICTIDVQVGRTE
jgi:hypothetical protein